jgi:predicted HTH domain antitoxin
MKSFLLEIPEGVLASAKIPKAQLESELRRRLAGTLYADGVISGSAACELAGLEKAEFQYWLGERGIAQPLDVSDYQLERENLEEWLQNA